MRIEGVSSDRTRCEGSPDDTSGHPMATPLAPRSRYNSSRSSALPPSRGHMHFCSAAWKGVRHSLLVGVVPMRPLTSCSLRVETRKNLPLRCPHREVARPEARSTPPCTLVAGANHIAAWPRRPDAAPNGPHPHGAPRAPLAAGPPTLKGIERDGAGDGDRAREGDDADHCHCGKQRTAEVSKRVARRG